MVMVVFYFFDWDVEWQCVFVNGGVCLVLCNIMCIVFVDFGSGMVDLIWLDDDVMVNVFNCVLFQFVCWFYEVEELIIMLWVLLVCDVFFCYGCLQFIVFNWLEVLLVCLLQGVMFIVDVMGGICQQGLVVNFCVRIFV